MWILLALLAAAASAGTSLLLKRAVGLAGVVVSTVAFRTVGGVLLAIASVAGGPLPAPTPTFWRALAIVIPNEIGGMLCLSMALSKGDVSVVQPLMGFIPLLTMAGGALILHEQPSGLAVAGILLVVMGLYFVGLPKGGSALEPIRALATSRASWYALLATLFWTVTSLTHKIGIAEVGPMPWATALTLGSAVALAVVLPAIARMRGGVGLLVREQHGCGSSPCAACASRCSNTGSTTRFAGRRPAMSWRWCRRASCSPRRWECSYCASRGARIGSAERCS